MVASVMLGIRSMIREDVGKFTRRIKVIVAQPEDSYQSLAQRSNIQGYPEQTLRLINGGYPNGEPRAGELCKNRAVIINNITRIRKISSGRTTWGHGR